MRRAAGDTHYVWRHTRVRPARSESTCQRYNSTNKNVSSFFDLTLLLDWLNSLVASKSDLVIFWQNQFS